MGYDPGGFCRCHALHGLCDSDVKGDESDGYADRKWCHDRLYLFGNYRFCGDFCG